MGNTQSKCSETTDSNWREKDWWCKRMGSEQHQCVLNMGINRRRGKFGRVRQDDEITDFIKFNGMDMNSQMKETYWTFIEI